jgi:hypothetical protein
MSHPTIAKYTPVEHRHADREREGDLAGQTRFYRSVGSQQVTDSVGRGVASTERELEEDRREGEEDRVDGELDRSKGGDHETANLPSPPFTGNLQGAYDHEQWSGVMSRRQLWFSWTYRKIPE